MTTNPSDQPVEGMQPTELEKRTRIYVMRPREYEIAGCPCGNDDPDWSEFVGHLWCDKCQKDFKPEHSGIFDGPICVQACEFMGISLSMFDIETGKIVSNEEYMAEGAALRGSEKMNEPLNQKEKTMKYEVAQDKNFPNEWRVEAIDFDGDGDCFVAMFSGPNAEARAKEYAVWKES